MDRRTAVVLAITWKGNWLDALIFDFDGVLLDSEPIHLMGFQRVLREVGIELAPEAYYRKYLGYSDRDCFAVVATDRGRRFSDSQIAEMAAAKTQIMQQAFRESSVAMPGAVRLVEETGEAQVPLGICSGSLRAEIELPLGAIGLRRHFEVIVADDDVQRGKPDPEGYRLTIQRLGEAAGREVAAGQSLVIEDSPTGIEAARAAGTKVLAITSSYQGGELTAADRVIHSLTEVTLADLAKMVQP